jgi:hypothetical protein
MVQTRLRAVPVPRVSILEDPILEDPILEDPILEDPMLCPTVHRPEVSKSGSRSNVGNDQHSCSQTARANTGFSEATA